jgi:hypothetical protein
VTAFRFPWEEAAPVPAPVPAPAASPKPRPGRPKGLGRAGQILARQPSLDEGASAGAADSRHTEWLACHLDITGPADAVGAFAAAAAGAGVTPWARDFAAEEEDVFYRLAARYPQTESPLYKPTQPTTRQHTNLGVRSSNLFGRASLS